MRSSNHLNSHLTFRESRDYDAPMAARKRSWGGARKGAGRPREIADPVRVTLDFERKQFDALRTLAERVQISASALIREAVRRLLRNSRR